MRHWFVRPLAALCATALLAGCGAAGSRALPAGPSAGPSTLATGTAKIVLTIPSRTGGSSSARSPRYVSPSTQSLVLVVQTVNGSAPNPAFPPVALNVVQGSSQCPYPPVGTPLTCTFSAVLPVGSVTFSISSYDAQQTTASPPAGNLLSTVTATQALTGKGDQISMTMDGVPVRATPVVPAGAQFSVGPTGAAAPIAISATAYDAQNNIIVGPGSYATPVQLGTSDARLSIAPAQLTAPGQRAQLTYNGGPGLQPGPVTATVGAATGTASVAFVPGLVKNGGTAAVAGSQLAVTPDGSKIYVTTAPDGANGKYPDLDVFSASTGALLKTVPLGQSPAGSCPSGCTGLNVAFSPDGSTAYVTYAPVGNASTSGVAVFSVASDTQTATIPIAGVAQGAVDPPGGKLYVLVNSPTTGKDSLQVFTPATSTTTPSSTLSSNSLSSCRNGSTCIAAASDGSQVYAADNAGGVDVINTATGTAINVGNDQSSGNPCLNVLGLNTSANGTRLLVACGNNNDAVLSFSSPVTTQPPATIGTLSTQSSTAGLTTSQDGTSVFVSALQVAVVYPGESEPPSALVIITPPSQRSVTASGTTYAFSYPSDVPSTRLFWVLVNGALQEYQY